MSKTCKIPKTYYDWALRFANTLRSSIGLKPASRLEKGAAGQPNRCPIARTVRKGWKGKGQVVIAIGDEFGRSVAHITRGNRQKTFLLPKATHKFIYLFDSNNAKGLIKPVRR